MAALAAATLAGSAIAVPPASASVSGHASFDGFAKGTVEDAVLANAETAARNNARIHGFTTCGVFESVVNQIGNTFLAVVTAGCFRATPASSRSISVDAWITVLIRCVLLDQELHQ
jgi:hypothetical protein